ncbi:hypothetical protein HHK36_024104 [Tetracentron sinense]|uniref:Uncharacterized protein n=1 Tax=Tetracentron sinense TaxID=13715 RepID=A0A834YP50_TETSI|nr:hypothetical protein HHK36_024104 [Tetracentron sinense]
MLLLRSSSTPIFSSWSDPVGYWSRLPCTAKNQQNILFPSSHAWHPNPIRRARSDGNLNAILSTEEEEEEEGAEADSPVRFCEVMPRRTWPNKCKLKPMAKLEPIPSFSGDDRDGNDTEEEDDDDDDDGIKEEEFSFPLMGGDHANGIEGNGGFGMLSFMNMTNDGVLGTSESTHNFFQEPSSLYMALGLGMEMDAAVVEGNTFDAEQMERHYERIVKENPANPLILRNYARFLYKTRRDFKKAEEYYFRAILEEPNDGEMLSEYGKLRWEVHRDEERASNYFERARESSPHNSEVLAAYASFLWDTEDREVGQGNAKDPHLCYAKPN